MAYEEDRVMRNLLSTLTLLTAFLVFQSEGQELPKSEKYEDVNWYSCNFTKFKAGKASEALSIIENHFIKVDKKIGRNVLAISFSTGDWDHMACFPLADGPAALAWKVRPDGEKW